MRDDFDFASDEFESVDVEAMYDELVKMAKKKSESFITTYVCYVEAMMKMSLSTMRLLTWITFSAEMNTGRVYLQSPVLTACLKELGMAKATYYKSMGELKEIGIIKGGNGRYFINPKFVWKGTADMRGHFLKAYPKLQ